uniref:BMP/retinoic acid inducible neural specific 3 n=1 Tax=Ornithorhynchus anatinus TaxID=9258 RepID=A0A6I8ND55_ORNAN
MALWEWIALSLHCCVLAATAVSDQHATSPFDWLLSDKGPFHRSQEYTDFVDRSRQGFSTRYKIYSRGRCAAGHYFFSGFFPNTEKEDISESTSLRNESFWRLTTQNDTSLYIYLAAF